MILKNKFCLVLIASQGLLLPIFPFLRRSAFCGFKWQHFPDFTHQHSALFLLVTRLLALPSSWASGLIQMEPFLGGSLPSVPSYLQVSFPASEFDFLLSLSASPSSEPCGVHPPVCNSEGTTEGRGAGLSAALAHRHLGWCG